jgi:predicted dehydrogenase
LAGGGIITDSGYHLLDIAAWIVSSLGVQIPEVLQGSVTFGFRNPYFAPDLPIDVETEAIGYVRLPEDIILSFDLSYHAPLNSIFEQIIISDHHGTKLEVLRNQSERTNKPGTVTHHQVDGNFAEIGSISGQRVRIDAVRFTGRAQTMEPLRLFIQSIRKEKDESMDTYVIQGKNSIPTWRLIREIYRLSSN